MDRQIDRLMDRQMTWIDKYDLQNNSPGLFAVPLTSFTQSGTTNMDM